MAFFSDFASQLLRTSRDLFMPPRVDAVKPKRRRRALTGTLDSSKDEPARAGLLAGWSTDVIQYTLEQEQSPFLQLLVADIRHLIYREILTGYTFHLSSSRTSSPPTKFECLRPWQIMDSVHGECHGKQLPKYLLSLPLTCRRIYSETITLLYQGNTFSHTQNSCFLNFLQSLPPQRYSSFSRLRYFHSVSKSLATAEAGAMRDWENFCKFMGNTFSPHLELYLDAHPNRFSATLIRRAEAVEEMKWLLPLWELSEKLQLKLIIPSGDSGAYRTNQPPPTEQMSVVLDFEEIKKSHNYSQKETLQTVFERMQLALWNWRPYGELIGEA